MKPGLTQQRTVSNALFPGATGITLENPVIQMVDAQSPSSGSGKNVLFSPVSTEIPRINTCYGCLTPSDPGSYHPVEIRGITEAVNIPECTLVPPGGLCVTVPGYSYGYFKSKINVSYTPVGQRTAYYPEAEISLYPNPAFSYFTFILDGVQSTDEIVKVAISTPEGKIVETLIVNQNSKIDISKLPAGLYMIEFMLENNQRITQSLIKIQ